MSSIVVIFPKESALPSTYAWEATHISSMCNYKRFERYQDQFTFSHVVIETRVFSFVRKETKEKKKVQHANSEAILFWETTI